MSILDNYVDKILDVIKEDSKQPEWIIRYDLKKVVDELHSDAFNSGYQTGLDAAERDQEYVHY